MPNVRKRMPGGTGEEIRSKPRQSLPPSASLTAKAPTIVDANAASTFTSGSALSSFSDMAPTPPLEKCRSRYRDEAATASPSRTLCSERTGEQCSNMVNRVLTAQDGHIICSQSRTLPILRRRGGEHLVLSGAGLECQRPQAPASKPALLLMTSARAAASIDKSDAARSPVPPHYLAAL